MSKLVEFGLVAVIGGCIVVGAYQAGKLSGREKVFAEIAKQNTRMKTIAERVGIESEEAQQEILRGLGADHEELARLEAELDGVRKRAREASAAVAPIACSPIPAQCLRRGAAAGAGAGDAAKGG